MKKIVYLLPLAFVILATSCKKEKLPKPMPEYWHPIKQDTSAAKA